MSVYNSLPEKKTDEAENLLFGIDRDTLLVAALLFLMIKDDGDMKLILALIYILL